MEKIRSFIAIPLSHNISFEIEKIHKELKALSADVKWVRPHSIHLTLKFLGAIDEEAIERIAQAIEKAIKGYRPWSVAIKNVGTFPSLRNPRVIWIGIEDKSDHILTFQNRIENELSRLGFEKEKRKFSPHLTLGRVRSSRGKRELVNFLIDQRERPFGEFTIDRAVLFKSELKPSGAVYSLLRKITF